MGTSDPLAIKVRELLDVRSTPGAANIPAATVSYHQGASGFAYEVIHIRGNGAPIPGLVGKVYANDYEKQGTTGDQFVPKPLETLESVYGRTGADIIINVGGSSMLSVEIKDGVIYRDFTEPGARHGNVAFGIRADGSSKVYDVNQGDTAESMLADGVINSFAFGPALVIDGAPVVSGSTETSSRQVLGSTVDGEILILSISGSTGGTGATYQTAATLAASIGMHNAVALDGGGSTQAMIDGHWMHPSSDPTGPRPIASMALIRARVTGATGTNWATMAPLNGFTSGTHAPSVRVRNGEAWFRGSVGHTTQTALATGLQVPWWALPDTHKRFPATINTIAQYYDVTPAGELKFFASSVNTGQRYLDVIRYPIK